MVNRVTLGVTWDTIVDKPKRGTCDAPGDYYGFNFKSVILGKQPEISKFEYERGGAACDWLLWPALLYLACGASFLVYERGVVYSRLVMCPLI